jgi:hypothetical protein
MKLLTPGIELTHLPEIEPYRSRLPYEVTPIAIRDRKGIDADTGRYTDSVV